MQNSFDSAKAAMENTFDRIYMLRIIECGQEECEMEIGTQIKKYRLASELSQEELAEKIYVTRQTISNWENGRNYPDVKSLLLLSSLINISLDILVKGDIEEMKEKINEEDIRRLNNDGKIYAVLLFITVLSIAPLFLFLHIAGIVIWAGIYAVTMFYAHRIEKQKKAHDIQTYKEIVAFSEGRGLSELEKRCEKAKYPYQKVILVISVALAAFVVAYLMMHFLAPLAG